MLQFYFIKYAIEKSTKLLIKKITEWEYDKLIWQSKADYFCSIFILYLKNEILNNLQYISFSYSDDLPLFQTIIPCGN